MQIAQVSSRNRSMVLPLLLFRYSSIVSPLSLSLLLSFLEFSISAPRANLVLRLSSPALVLYQPPSSPHPHPHSPAFGLERSRNEDWGLIAQHNTPPHIIQASLYVCVFHSGHACQLKTGFWVVGWQNRIQTRHCTTSILWSQTNPLPH